MNTDIMIKTINEPIIIFELFQIDIIALLF